MIDLTLIRSVKAKDVPLGHLVLSAYGSTNHYALRIEAAFDHAPDCCGLLFLSASAPDGRRENVLCRDMDDEQCIYIGAPRITWDGAAGSIGPYDSWLGESGRLIVTGDGPAIIGRGGPHLRDVFAWNFVTGKPIRSRGFLVASWKLGVTDLNGDFKSVLSHPSDYESRPVQ